MVSLLGTKAEKFQDYYFGVSNKVVGKSAKDSAKVFKEVLKNHAPLDDCFTKTNVESSKSVANSVETLKEKLKLNFNIKDNMTKLTKNKKIKIGALAVLFTTLAAGAFVIKNKNNNNK